MNLIRHDNQLVRWTSWAVLVVVGWFVLVGAAMILFALVDKL